MESGGVRLVSKECKACGEMMHYVTPTEERHDSCAAVNGCERCNRPIRGAHALCRSCDESTDSEREALLRAAIDEVYNRDPFDERLEFVCRSCLRVRSKVRDVRLIIGAGRTPWFYSRYRGPECDECYRFRL
jgi:hypothetical protein